ncbi:MAG: VTT domain-containing protein [Bacteroidetes bacterium]|nr:VTT domain-containing protein [Bacteroidota bacterium]
MHEVWSFIKELVNPESIISYGGFWLLLFVVYSETGLFVGFFLPGDSLLFTAGLLTATGIIGYPIYFVVLGVCLAAILGNSTGYAFGKKAGQTLFKRKKSFFFRPTHLKSAKEFYDKHGGKAIIMGSFLPIIRTFAPIVAGAVELKYSKFFLYNLIGAILWSHTMILAGYFSGKYIPGVKEYLHYIIIFLVVITAIPVISTYLKERKLRKSGN